MVPPVLLSRPCGLRLLGGLAAGLVLVFGGTCAVGPTSLSAAAVSANLLTATDDARSQAPVPVAAQPAVPARRMVRRRPVARARRYLAGLTRPLTAALRSATTPRAPPPLRGPPLLAG